MTPQLTGRAAVTVLNFLLTDDAVYVVTDSLLSDADDLSPLAFTTKVYPLPHLQALICGTGHAQRIIEWVATVNITLLATNVVHLDRLAPAALRQLFARYPKEQSAGRDITTTLYHFGFDDREQRFAGFAYRSADDFQSERLQEGFGFKPAPDWPIDGKKITKLPQEFIAIARKQKLQDEATMMPERVGVGGQLLFHAMQRIPGARGKPVVQTSAAICHTFPDFAEMHAIAAAKLLKP